MIKAKDLAKLTQSEVRELNIEIKDILFDDDDDDDLIKKAWHHGWRGIGRYYTNKNVPDLTREEYNKYLNNE